MESLTKSIKTTISHSDLLFFEDLKDLIRNFLNSFNEIRFLKQVNNKSLLEECYYKTNSIIVNAIFYESVVTLSDLLELKAGLQNCSASLTVSDYHSKDPFVITFDYSIEKLSTIIRQLSEPLSR